MKSVWQRALSRLIKEPEILFQQLGLAPEKHPALFAQAKKAAELFQLRVTESFVARIEKNNPEDPLLLQILPAQAEFLDRFGFIKDPLQESQFNPLPGLLHKYHGRVLLTLTGACGIHCRYCFRREFDYQSNNPSKKGWASIFHYLSEKKEITEVILSGGDPLTISTNMLQQFTEQLQKIPQINTLRIHTRMPIILPERIDNPLINWLKALTLKKVVVLHVNHPNEINQTVIQQLNLLKKADLVLLNQAVLLKKINDCPKILTTLSQRLFHAGVLPYYLHLLDKIKGATHFDVSEKQAKKILKTLQENLPGYLVPKLVKETPQEKHKIML